MITALAAICLMQQRLPSHVNDRDFKLAVKVTLNGEQIQFPDTQPMMVASRILVPMRGVFEQMGAHLDWDSAKQTVTATRGSRKVILVIGKNTATLDESTVPLDQPAITVRGRTMVPLRFLGQSLGVDVDWHAADRTVALVSHE